MNGFHMHAIGWLLVFNASGCSREQARQLTGLWEETVRSHAEDLSAAPLFRRVMQTRSIRLSKNTLGAMARLIRFMVADRPERFGWDALRRRRNTWAFQMALGFVLCAFAARFLPRSWPMATEMVPTFFLLGCLFTVPTVLLWRAASAVKYCTERTLEIETVSRDAGPADNRVSAGRIETREQRAGNSQ